MHKSIRFSTLLGGHNSVVYLLLNNFGLPAVKTVTDFRPMDDYTTKTSSLLHRVGISYFLNYIRHRGKEMLLSDG